MSPCCKCGGIVGNQPLKSTKWGHFKDPKWFRHKIETFRGAILGAKKVEGTSKTSFWGGKFENQPCFEKYEMSSTVT